MSDKKDKDKKAKGDKKDKKAKKAAPDGAMSVAAHPRAAAQVRMAKGWGGLAAFLVTAYLSYAHGIAPAIAGERALIAGVAGYLVAWACVVMVWRQLMVAELRARVERARAALEPPPADGAAKSADAKPASDSA